ncbi:hypothetical protein ACJRPK_16295 [Aquimarina sp. 2-A2]|uniref:hypothetical protein n=1 Tax=Aquimarina sp. 2-A2 TaxID=3382644 RepID=UPI00387F1BB7
MTFFKEKEVLNIEQIYIITYDENDNSITTEILYGDGSLIQRHKVFYNSKGQKYKRIFYNQYHTSSETFTYNSSGDIEKMVKYEEKDNKLQFECKIVYKYDKNKNWIFRKETDSSSDTEKVIERTITYYK